MYVTTGQLCSYQGIRNPSEADKVQLGGFIVAAQAIIERRTHRIFEAAADSTRYLDARRNLDCGLLWLDDDLCQITTVTNGNGVVVEPTQYVTEPRHALPWYALRMRSDANLSWTYSGAYEDSIAIVGRWAYRLAPPPDIMQATLRLASWLFRQKDTGNSGVDTPLMVGDGGVIMPAALPTDVAAILKPYVKSHG